ncbi:prolyl oligopeptidase family serine peptidase [Roseibium sp. SCPC15]|uniref:alpha/beta hydrolase family protein n=1 Tax=Roseibium sp. SCP15 TaxID=3141376 RepID=UPI00333A0DE5
MRLNEYSLRTSLLGIVASALFTISATCVVGLTPAQAGDVENTSFGPGVTKLTVEDERRDRPLSGDIWYPTSTPEKFSRADKSKVWQMALADPGGPAANGSYPLLVVSHGMYGNTFNQAWLGSELARRGFVVAMINHPGTSTFLRDPDQARELWERPRDLSRLITYLTEDSPFKDLIDSSRIYAAGHSLGGFTVMLIAGAEFDDDLYRSSCAVENAPVACEVLAGWSVAETQSDRNEMETSRKDPRVLKVVSLDLGGTPVLSRESLASVDTSVLVLGSERADMLNQDVESRALAAALPSDKVRHLELTDAGHFDFMGVCKPEGYEILKVHEPGDEIVCIKGTTERERQHRIILEELLNFLAP